MPEKVKDITQIVSNDEKKSGNPLKDGITRPIGRVGEFATNFVTEDLKEQITKNKNQAGDLTAVGVFRATLKSKDIDHLSWIADLLQLFAGLAFDALDKILKLLNLVDEKLLGGTINKIFGAEKEEVKKTQEGDKKKPTSSVAIQVGQEEEREMKEKTDHIESEAEKKVKEEARKAAKDSSNSATNPDSTKPVVGTHTAKLLQGKGNNTSQSNSI